MTISDQTTGSVIGTLPRVVYDNVFRDGTIVATIGTGRYLADWRADRNWEGTIAAANVEVTLTASRTVNSLFIFGHNLGTGGCDVSAQYHNGATWVNLHTPISPADDTPIFVLFDTSPSATKFRVLMTSTSVAKAVAICVIGTSLQLQEGIQPGWSPPGFADAPGVIDNESEDGLLLGRSIVVRPQQTQLSLADFGEVWARANWRTFRAHAIQYPWGLFFDDGGGGDVVLAWTDGVPPRDQMSRPGFFRVSWPIKILTGTNTTGGQTLQEECPESSGGAVFSAIGFYPVTFTLASEEVA